MGKVMRHTLGASLNIRHNLSSSKGPKPLQLKFLTHVFFCVSKNVSVSCAYTQGKREQFSGFNRTLDAINNVFRKFSAFHDETGRLNVDGMNILSNDGSNKLNRSRKARVSYKVQRTINASLNAATSTRAVSSNPNFVTRQKIEIIFGSNLQSFIASMTQKLTLSDISDESKNYLDKAGITTACLRIKSKWTAGGK